MRRKILTNQVRERPRVIVVWFVSLFVLSESAYLDSIALQADFDLKQKLLNLHVGYMAS